MNSYIIAPEAMSDLEQIIDYLAMDNVIAVFSRMRGNRILERLTVQDCNTPHSCDYRYNKGKNFLNEFNKKCRYLT